MKEYQMLVSLKAINVLICIALFGSSITLLIVTNYTWLAIYFQFVIIILFKQAIKLEHEADKIIKELNR